MATLQDFFISKVRSKLIEVFLNQPGEIFYIRQLTRLTEEQINAVRRELERLEKVGAVRKEARANRIYYQMRRDYLFYDELLRMVTKTKGLGGAIIKNRNKIGKIKFVMLSGKLIRNRPKVNPDEIDLLLVGEIVLPQVAVLVQMEEKRRNREINYTAMTVQEFEFRKKRRDPFILGILSSSKIMLIGDEEEMLK